mgnify:CR=1 FL=1
MYEVNPSAPGSSVKGAEVRPDRGTIQPSVVHAPEENFLTGGVNFNIADCPIVHDGTMQRQI